MADAIGTLTLSNPQIVGPGLTPLLSFLVFDEETQEEVESLTKTATFVVLDNVVATESVMALSNTTYQGGENTILPINVLRSGELDAVVTTDWAITGISPPPVPASGVVTFSSFDALQPINVALPEVSALQTGSIALSNPQLISGLASGAILGSPNTANVQVLNTSGIVVPQSIVDASALSGVAISDIFHPGYYSTSGNPDENIPSEVFSDPAFRGAMIGYHWRELEPSFGVYDFTKPQAHYDQLAASGKRLWMRLGGVSFSVSDGARTPAYMDNNFATYGGDGIVPHGNYVRNAQAGGQSWALENDNVLARFNIFITAVANWAQNKPFFEGITGGESALGRNIPDTTKLSRSFDTMYAHLANEMHSRGKVATAGINFATFYQPGGTTGMLEGAKAAGIGLTYPDLKDGNSILSNEVYPFHLANHDLLVTAGEVQWADYDPPQNTDKTVPGIRDFGETVCNMHYLMWRNRPPWWNGSPTSPVPGPNVQTMIQTPLAAAKAFYDSLP